MGWWAAGGLLIVLILVVAWPIVRPDQVGPAAPQASGAAPSGAAAVDLNSMTPRQAADALFDRVMRTASAGDSLGAAQFVPMAIQAYDRARPLDLDGLFHLSTLMRTGGDFAGAVAAAEEGLAENGNHLLLLYAAGEASSEAGDTASARGYFQRVLDAYDAEMASGNFDYEAHGDMMASVREDARSYLAGGA